MNGMTQSSGTASFWLYMPMKSSWSMTAPSPGCTSSALSLTPSHQASSPLGPSSSSSSSSGKCAAILSRKALKAFSCISFSPG